MIAEGLGPRMMTDYYELCIDLPGEDDYKWHGVYAICPARKGDEGGHSHFMENPCVFLVDSLCELHSDRKPFEGRMATCVQTDSDPELHDKVARMWDNPEAQALVAEWKEQYGRTR